MKSTLEHLRKLCGRRTAGNRPVRQGCFACPECGLDRPEAGRTLRVSRSPLRPENGCKKLEYALGVLWLLAGFVSGCRQDEEARVKEHLKTIRAGMSRDQVAGVLGTWGRRHFWKTEASGVPPGWTEDQQRKFEVNKGERFDLLVPETLLETIPLADGATVVDHFTFNKHHKFAVGYLFSDLMFFYEARTGLLLGYGYIGHRISGRRDLSDLSFFHHEEVSLP